MSEYKTVDPKMPTSPFHAHYLNPDDKLCRVYNMVSGQLHNFGALSWNTTTPPPRNRRKGGRFDATKSDPYHWLYGAEASKNADVAILETLSSFVHDDVTRGRPVIPRAKVNEFALQYFRVSREVCLAELRTREGRAALNASAEVAFDKNRVRTRDWCRYFRSASDDIQGLAYNSWRGDYRQKRASFVLFEDRLNGLQFYAASGLVPFNSGKGRKCVNKVLGDQKILII